jgi:hypothetical protein
MFFSVIVVETKDDWEAKVAVNLALLLEVDVAAVIPARDEVSANSPCKLVAAAPGSVPVPSATCVTTLLPAMPLSN